MTNNKQQDDTRIAIIGAGKIVEDAHLAVLKTMPGIKVEWIADPRHERRTLLEEMYGVRGLDPKDALDALSDVDACLIAIPLGARKPYLQRCADLNVAAYVEKPFARTAQEHKDELNAFPNHAIAVGFQRRAYQSVQVLREIIATGMFGALKSIELTEASFTLSSGGATSFRSSAASAGGGITIESAIHSLDQMLYVTSATDIETHQISGIARDGIDYQVSLDAQLKVPHQGDVDVRVFLSRLQSLPERFEFRFERAVVHLPAKPGRPLMVSGVGGASIQSMQLRPTGGSNGSATSISQAFIVFWNTYIDGLHNESVNYTSAATSLLTTQWIEQIYTHFLANDELVAN